jgi:hypothetical protein
MSTMQPRTRRSRRRLELSTQETLITEPPKAHQPELTGLWHKVGAPTCAEKYPNSLTFSAGTYRGARGKGQGFILWDAGIYRVEDQYRLLLSVATDELVTYEIHLHGNVLAVVDPGGCHFSYQRVPPTG